jgi:hypothetical protein
VHSSEGAQIITDDNHVDIVVPRDRTHVAIDHGGYEANHDEAIQNRDHAESEFEAASLIQSESSLLVSSSPPPFKRWYACQVRRGKCVAPQDFVDDGQFEPAYGVNSNAKSIRNLL